MPAYLTASPWSELDALVALHAKGIIVIREPRGGAVPDQLMALCPDGSKLTADDPLSLLGLVALVDALGPVPATSRPLEAVVKDQVLDLRPDSIRSQPDRFARNREAALLLLGEEFDELGVPINNADDLAHYMRAYEERWVSANYRDEYEIDDGDVPVRTRHQRWIGK